MKIVRIALLGAALAGTGIAAAFAQQKPKADPALVDRVVAATFKGASDVWKKRIEQDEAQRLCSEHKGEPPAAVAAKIVAAQKATIVMPADGKVMGNWQEGAKIAQNGRGGQFSDDANTVGGGNCYACHQLSAAELSFGTMGPTLNQYGKIRKFREEDAKAAYAKIYNSQSVLACSNMPRFGLTKALSEQQIKDVVAYLFDPASPVNK